MYFKKNKNLLFWILLLLGIFFLKEKQNIQVQKTLPQEAKNLTQIPIKKTSSIEIPKREVPLQPQFRRNTELSTKISRKPEGNTIEFKVVDGLAIAYGDIILGKPEAGSEAKQGYYEAPNPLLWERPEIPYYINPDLPNPERVEQALEYFRANTPIRFVPYQGQKDAIVFESDPQHCYSMLGRVGGVQPIRISEKCQLTEILHELMHVLGFIHEQSRPDRDQYVEILWENIEDRFKDQFAIVPETFFEPIRGSDFDFQSIMMYPSHAFAIQPELLTLRSKLESRGIAPVRERLSASDLARVNHLYGLYERN